MAVSCTPAPGIYSAAWTKTSIRLPRLQTVFLSFLHPSHRRGGQTPGRSIRSTLLLPLVQLLGDISDLSSLQSTVNYTLAQTHDDDSNIGPYGIDSALNPFNLSLDRGYSTLDVRHTLNVSAIFNLPYGFKFNPLLLVHSASPYTAITGVDQHDANDFNDRAIANGTQTSRNVFRQPTFSDADIRIVKDITLKGEGHHLDLFMDLFNVIGSPNRNFGPEQVSLYGTPSSPVFSAAQPLFAPGVTRFGGPARFSSPPGL